MSIHFGKLFHTQQETLRFLENPASRFQQRSAQLYRSAFKQEYTSRDVIHGLGRETLLELVRLKNDFLVRQDPDPAKGIQENIALSKTLIDELESLSEELSWQIFTPADDSRHLRYRMLELALVERLKLHHYDTVLDMPPNPAREKIRYAHAQAVKAMLEKTEYYQPSDYIVQNLGMEQQRPFTAWEKICYFPLKLRNQIRLAANIVCATR